MKRLTIKGFKAAGFLLKAAASGIESLLEETYPVLREGAKRIGLSPKDFTHIEISNKAFNEATSIKGISPFCKITLLLFDLLLTATLVTSLLLPAVVPS